MAYNRVSRTRSIGRSTDHAEFGQRFQAMDLTETPLGAKEPAGDRYHIDEWREAAHRPNVNLQRISSRRDEIEQSVDAVVSNARVTRDPRLFHQCGIVLTLEVANYSPKGKRAVSVVARSQGHPQW
jgi:hypothetical protein